MAVISPVRQVACDYRMTRPFPHELRAGSCFFQAEFAEDERPAIVGGAS